MQIHQIDISKKMVVAIDNDEIQLIIDTLNNAVANNQLTTSGDEIAKAMVSRLRTMPNE